MKSLRMRCTGLARGMGGKKDADSVVMGFAGRRAQLA
jgi:hypothetical protein